MRDPLIATSVPNRSEKRGSGAASRCWSVQDEPDLT
jgi:hypothetical protein